MKSTLLAATLLLSALILWHAHSTAQSAGSIPENLDSIIVAGYQASNIPGMFAAIIKENKIAWMRPYGWADIPNRKPWRPNTLHRVASISKTMMQAAVMQLVERHQISLDDSVNRFLPFRVANPWNPQVTITVRMLMAHTSTIYDDYTYALNPNLKVGDNPMSYKTFLETYPIRYLIEKPGTRYVYTNTGSCLLAYIVDRVTGRTFEEYMRDSIFTPLGLDPIGYFLRDLDTSLLAHAYDQSLHDFGFLSYPVTPTGGIRTTLPNIAKWVLTHMNGGTWNSVRILQDSTVAQMLTPLVPGDNDMGTDSCGLIWYETAFGAYPRKMWGHAGGTHGYISFMGFDPATKIGIITFMNGSNSSGRPGNVNWWLKIHETILRVADTLRPAPLSTPSRIDFRADTPETTSVYTCSNLFGPVTVTALSLPPGEQRVSLIGVPPLPLVLNNVGDSLGFRIGYKGTDATPHKSYITFQTNDPSSPTQQIPIVIDIPRSLAGPVVCTGHVADNAFLRGSTVNLRILARNNGSSVTAPAVEGAIRSLDTAAAVVSGSPFAVGDIAPGEVKQSSKIAIAFSPGSGEGRNILFEIRFLSNGIEYWRSTLSILVTSVGDQQGFPTAYALEQNYPNPFNPSTTVRFTIGGGVAPGASEARPEQREGGPAAAQVRLSVYDMLGREVARLVNERKEPGTYAVSFDGSHLGSGVYFYRLTAGSFTQSRRMSLIR